MLTEMLEMQAVAEIGKEIGSEFNLLRTGLL